MRFWLALLPLLAACGLVLAAVAAPLCEGERLFAASNALYGLLGGVCHQIPTRSIFLGASHMALCGRCFALYGGAALAGAAVLALRRPPLRPLAAALLVLPCLLDALAPDFGLWPQTMASPIFTGFLAGAGIALFLYPRYLSSIDGAFRRPARILRTSEGETS